MKLFVANRVMVPAMVTRLSGEHGLVNRDIDRYVRYAQEEKISAGPSLINGARARMCTGLHLQKMGDPKAARVSPVTKSKTALDGIHNNCSKAWIGFSVHTGRAPAFDCRPERRSRRDQLSWPFRVVRIDYYRHAVFQDFLQQSHGVGRTGRIDAR
jgi:hypothetical protein